MSYLLDKHNYIKRCLHFCVVLLIVLSLSFSCCFLFKKEAYAEVNGEDKLYGETLSQRGMKLSQCPSISAKYAVLMDKSGNIIYERDAYAPAKIASMTKIMTAIVGLENSDPSDTLVITEKAVKVGESSAGFWVGDKLDMKSALYALMVPSGNDAAEAICEYVGGKAIENQDDRVRLKSVDDVEAEAKENDIETEDVEDVFAKTNDQAFCMLMNSKAKELSCSNTCFTNPHGLDDEEFANHDQTCCAADIGKITQYAMQIPDFRAIVGGGDTSITVVRNGSPVVLDLKSTDGLLGKYEGCIGVKTGVTDSAGACFSGAVTSNGTEIYTIVMNCKDEAQRFIDTQDLWNWYYQNKIDYKPSNTTDVMQMTVDDETKEVGVVAYVANSDWVDCTIPTTTMSTDDFIPVLTVAGNLYSRVEPGEVSGSYKAGDIVGKIVYSQHNSDIASLDLVAIQDQPSPNIFEMIGVSFDRFVRSLTGQPTCAQTNVVKNNTSLNI